MAAAAGLMVSRILANTSTGTMLSFGVLRNDAITTAQLPSRTAHRPL